MRSSIKLSLFILLPLVLLALFVGWFLQSKRAGSHSPYVLDTAGGSRAADRPLGGDEGDRRSAQEPLPALQPRKALAVASDGASVGTPVGTSVDGNKATFSNAQLGDQTTRDQSLMAKIASGGSADATNQEEELWPGVALLGDASVSLNANDLNNELNNELNNDLEINGGAEGVGLLATPHDLLHSGALNASSKVEPLQTGATLSDSTEPAEVGGRDLTLEDENDRMAQMSREVGKVDGAMIEKRAELNAAAADTWNKFLTATSIEEKLQCVIDPLRVGTQFRNYYEAASQEAQKSLEPQGTLTSERQGAEPASETQVSDFIPLGLQPHEIEPELARRSREGWTWMFEGALFRQDVDRGIAVLNLPMELLAGPFPVFFQGL